MSRSKMLALMSTASEYAIVSREAAAGASLIGSQDGTHGQVNELSRTAITMDEKARACLYEAASIAAALRSAEACR